MATAELMRTKKWTRAEYYKLVDQGFFDGQHVELIDGELVIMSPQNAPHAGSTEKIARILQEVFSKSCHVRRHSPLSLRGASDPEPDIAVIPGDAADFLDQHPATAELVVEIALSTLRYDRTRKASVYARAGIPEYWIVNLSDHQLEVLRDPAKLSGREYTYRSRQILNAGDTVAPLSLPKAKIAVKELLPRLKH